MFSKKILDFIKAHFILCIFCFFATLFGWIIFQSIKEIQIFSDVNFDKGEKIEISAGKSITLPLSIKTDSLVALHIPLIFNEEILPSDIDVNINNGSKIYFEKKLAEKKLNTAILLLEFPQTLKIKSLTLTCSKDLTYLSNGKNIQTKQYGLQKKFQAAFCIFYIFLVAFAYVIFYAVHRFIKSFALKYFIYSIALGCVCICIWPAFNISDERVHFNTANFHANVITGIQSKDDIYKKEIILRKCDNQIYPDSISSLPRFTRDLSEIFEIKDYKRYYAYAFPKILKRTNSSEYVTIHGDFSYGNIFYYAPHVLGILISRALHLNQFILYYFSCFLSLLFSTAIITFAFFKSKTKSILLYFLTLNPAFMQQACHFSYDGIIFSCAFAFVVLFFSYLKNKKISDLILASIFLILTYPAKGHIYMALALLYLILIKKQLKFLFNKKKVFYPIVILLLAICAFKYISYINNNPDIFYQSLSFHDDPVSRHTLTYVLLNPIDTIFRCLYSISVNSGVFIKQAAGLTLGVRNLYASFFIQICFLFILYFSAVDSSNIALTRNQKKLCLGLSFLAYFLSFVAFFYSFATRSNIVIEGVQGRYYIPFIPIILMSLPEKIKQNKVYAHSDILQLVIPLYVLIEFLDIFTIIIR